VGNPEKSTNPISYLNDIGVEDIHRFVLTHPDMDHLDGFDELAEEFQIINFWDSGVRRDKPDFSVGHYTEADWDRYVKFRDGKEPGVRVITPLAEGRFKYANQSDDGTSGGDGLYILAPDKDLVAGANDTEICNDASYVLLYRSQGGRILIPGDAHDETWEYVIEHFAADVADCSVLLAPHHGRRSGASFEFLDTVSPKLTLFGCASSGHLAYNGVEFPQTPRHYKQRGRKHRSCNPRRLFGCLCRERGLRAELRLRLHH
jgi:competence protein ComEC